MEYLVGKVDYYDWVRKGRPGDNHSRPIFLAEEFGDQMGMDHVVDALTDGYIGDIRGGNGARKTRPTSNARSRAEIASAVTPT